MSRSERLSAGNDDDDSESTRCLLYLYEYIIMRTHL